ncbi:MAG: response regulator [Candidatus Acidiferrales bacterium]
MPRILVADDNTNIQKMVVLAFQERGVEVITVGNGEAAVRRLPDVNPDLVLADVFMPVRNGYEVCEFVKKDARFSHVPVILLVGAFDPLDEKEARRVGADGVLKKPFVPPDPLIAMVMSALEKNPKVAAELAKAKEVAAEAALPAVVMESPLKAEPKPLPEFPEPTAEEAAVIYGFGKGVRGLDTGEEEEEEDEDETPKAKKKAKPVKESKAPKAPAAPKVPVVAAEDDEEEVDQSTTANDWRRSAADFEVPENVAADPVYSYGQNFEPITFPSERDVPPKRVRVEDASAEALPKTAEPPAVADLAPAALQAPESAAPKRQPWDVDQPEIELATGFFAQPEPIAEVKPVIAEIAKAEPVVEAKTAVEEKAVVEEKPEVAEAAQQEPKRVQASAPEPVAEREEPAETTARPSFVSRVRGWMDMLSPLSTEDAAGDSSEGADGHWTAKLSSTEAGPAAVEASTPVAAAEDYAEQAAVQEAVSATAVEPAAEPATETQSSGSAPFFAPVTHAETHEDAASNPDFAPTAESETAAQEEPREFGEGKLGEAKFGGSSYHFSDDAHEQSHEAAPEAREEVEQPATASDPVAADFPPETEPEPVTSSGFDFAPELLPAPADVPQNGGGLSGLMPAEPLFAGERQHEQTDYSAHDGEPPQPDMREQEAFAEETHPGQLFQPAPDDDYWDREAAAHEEAIQAQANESLFDESGAEAAEQGLSERIPTLPPPNREALSEIPFLMPPVLPPQNVSQSAAVATSAETVDEVVRKVMEKLGPHLQELLSQGVKPLVENLLQNELHKKEK